MSVAPTRQWCRCATTCLRAQPRLQPTVTDSTAPTSQSRRANLSSDTRAVPPTFPRRSRAWPDSPPTAHAPFVDDCWPQNQPGVPTLLSPTRIRLALAWRHRLGSPSSAQAELPAAYAAIAVLAFLYPQ